MVDWEQIRASREELPGLFWLIFLVIWAVGKFLKSLTDKESPSPSSPRDSGKPPPNLEMELREFIESVTGEATTKNRPSVHTPSAPTPPPTPAIKQRPLPPTRESKAVKKDRTQVPAPLREMSPQPVLIDKPDSVLDGIEGVVSSDTHGSHKYILTGFKGLSLKMPGMRLPNLERNANATIQYSVPDRDSLKRAMIDRIVLGPPRAIADFSQEDQQKTK